MNTPEQQSKSFNFFEEIKIINQKNKEIFENVALGRIADDIAALESNNLWKEFIYRFHYPHEKVPAEFGTNKITNENTQSLK